MITIYILERFALCLIALGILFLSLSLSSKASATYANFNFSNVFTDGASDSTLPKKKSLRYSIKRKKK